MSFNYKEGEDYTCRLCGGQKHATGSRLDGLCDSCRELKTRIELQPSLARKVLQELEGVGSFSFMGNDSVEQTPGETLHVLTYELGKVIEYYHKAKRYGEEGYYCVANQQKEMSDLISMVRFYCEQRGWGYTALTQLGEQAYLERQEDLRKFGLKRS